MNEMDREDVHFRTVQGTRTGRNYLLFAVGTGCVHVLVPAHDIVASRG